MVDAGTWKRFIKRSNDGLVISVVIYFSRVIRSTGGNKVVSVDFSAEPTDISRLTFNMARPTQYSRGIQVHVHIVDVIAGIYDMI